MISLQEVYNTLTYNWQTGQQIRDKIAQGKKKKSYQIADGTIYVRLNVLVQNGFADMRERDPTEEEMKRRGNNKVSEYRKTGKEIPDSGIEYLLLPELAPA